MRVPWEGLREEETCEIIYLSSVYIYLSRLPRWPRKCRIHETQARSLVGEDPLEEETATYSSILA